MTCGGGIRRILPWFPTGRYSVPSSGDLEQGTRGRSGSGYWGLKTIDRLEEVHGSKARLYVQKAKALDVDVRLYGVQMSVPPPRPSK